MTHDWPYTKTFHAVANAVTREAGGIGISVEKFAESFGPMADIRKVAIQECIGQMADIRKAAIQECIDACVKSHNDYMAAAGWYRDSELGWRMRIQRSTEIHNANVSKANAMASFIGTLKGLL